MPRTFNWDVDTTSALIDGVKVRDAFYNQKNPLYLRKGPHALLVEEICNSIKASYPEKASQLTNQGMYHHFIHSLYTQHSQNSGNTHGKVIISN